LRIANSEWRIQNGEGKKWAAVLSKESPGIFCPVSS